MILAAGTDITLALQAEIDRLAAQGGGEIVVPPGRYDCRPLRVASNLTLCLQNGARILASGKRSDYAPVGYDHNEMGTVYSWLYGERVSHFVLCGEGTIDLNGRAFYHLHLPSEVTTVGPAITKEHLDEAPRTYDWRVNQPIFFNQCSNLVIKDLTIVDAPCWTLSFHACHTIQVRGLTVENSLVIPNNDGMHFCGCDGVVVSDCHIQAGDDCVALSSITDWNLACENVVITNCVFQSASKALSIGYMHSIVRNVTISNVVVKASNRAFVCMVHPGTGLVENLRVQNCVFEARSYGGNWWGNGEPIVLMITPHHNPGYRDPEPARRFEVGLRNLWFHNISCRAERPNAVVASEPMTSGIHFSDLQIELVPEQKLSLKGNVIDLAPGPANYPVPRPGIGFVFQNASPRVAHCVGAEGRPVECVQIDVGLALEPGRTTLE